LMESTLPTTPLLPDGGVDALHQASAVYALAGRLRNLKAEYRLAARKDVRFVAKGAPEWLQAEAEVIGLLVGAEKIDFEEAYEAPKGTPGAVTDAGEFFLPLEGLIDMDAERKRLDKEIGKVEKEVQKAGNKLGNEKFVANAKPEVVAVERERLAEWEGKLAQLKELRAGLGE
ncbi:MAG: valine--tRNA ligase, partial [Verrucomicrobiales bacterium]